MSLIRRKKRETEFTILPNDMLQRRDMSMKSKGLLAYLLSLPPNWEIKKTELQNHFKDGREAVTSAFDELVEMQYISVTENPRVGGRLPSFTYEVDDTPIVLPLRVSRSGLTAAVNPQLQSTIIESTLLSKEDGENLRRLKSEFLNAQAYLELVCMQNSIDMEFCLFMITKYFLELEINEELRKEARDARNHFNRWTRMHKMKYKRDFVDQHQAAQLTMTGETIRQGGGMTF